MKRLPVFTLIGIVIGAALVGYWYFAGSTMHQMGGDETPRAAAATLDDGEKKSANGAFTVAFAPEGEMPGIGPIHAWIVMVKDSSGAPVEDGTISVTGGMESHGHGLPTQPEIVAYLGEGRYRLDGMKFSMAGPWEFDLEIAAGEMSDTVRFEVMVE